MRTGKTWKENDSKKLSFLGAEIDNVQQMFIGTTAITGTTAVATAGTPATTGTPSMAAVQNRERSTYTVIDIGGIIQINRSIYILAAIALLLPQLFFARRVLHEVGVSDQVVWERINGTYKTLTYGMRYMSNREDRPGYKLAKEGAKATYPIIMIPGFVTSGLELWAGEDCARKYFRQRLWGSISMAQTFISDIDCWRRHLSLDPYTGSDPENVRIRAAQGFEAADYFMATYWVWGKLIENLSDVGYDGSLMTMMSYDWRLSFPVLEERDGYFTKLKYAVEGHYKTSGKKVVLASHSMGSSLVLYFFQWVELNEQRGGGGGGKGWVERHIHSFVNIAGPLLGAPKAVSALLSGEMSNTAALLPPVGAFAEQLISKRQRKNLFNTWGSVWSMLPKGGSPIWGTGADLCSRGQHLEGFKCVTKPDNKQDAMQPQLHATKTIPLPIISITNTTCDISTVQNSTCNLSTKELEADVSEITHADSALREVPVTKRDPRSRKKTKTTQETAPLYSKDGMPTSQEWSVEDAVNLIQKWGGGYGPTVAGARHHSFGPSTERSIIPQDKWHNPLVTPLPHAPSMKVYCLYGVGLDTDRAYFYKKGCTGNCPSEGPTDPPIVLDTSVQDLNQNIRIGVRFSDGDGSVPLLSLGLMCVDGWAKGEKGPSRLNPSGSTVITREYQHKEGFQVNDPLHGGPYSGEHVDIMGNVATNEDILRIVTNFGTDKLSKNRLVSNIETIAQEINQHPLGGIKTKVPQRRRRNRFLPKWIVNNR